jgi:hypothetical protein
MMVLFFIIAIAQATTKYPRVNIHKLDSGIGIVGETTDQQAYSHSCSLFVVTDYEDAAPKLGI